MTAVEIRRRSENGEVEAIARVSVPAPGAPAVIDPLGSATLAMVQGLLARVGVVDRIGAIVDPTDGEAYVRALPGSLRGSRLWADAVPTGD